MIELMFQSDDGNNGLSLIEIQGTIEIPYNATDINYEIYLENEFSQNPTLKIGNQMLQGKRIHLQNPIAVASKTNNERIEVNHVIHSKLLFNTRPLIQKA